LTLSTLRCHIYLFIYCEIKYSVKQSQMQKQSVNSFTLDEEYLLQNKDNSSQQTAISSINMFTV